MAAGLASPINIPFHCGRDSWRQRRIEPLALDFQKLGAFAIIDAYPLRRQRSLCALSYLGWAEFLQVSTLFSALQSFLRSSLLLSHFVHVARRVIFFCPVFRNSISCPGYVRPSRQQVHKSPRRCSCARRRLPPGDTRNSHLLRPHRLSIAAAEPAPLSQDTRHRVRLLHLRVAAALDTWLNGEQHPLRLEREQKNLHERVGVYN
ncbi:hypothetical protein DFH07DRAFT_400328 [Mycena maculata]|uniref:Uncharacterized protein n=1 Tax=Mycena maculata TaxID=230809 RepID=A0AAD7JEL4_9AGAR|nr:hypothetical protein DFH07DRAFT_400328 [Mycena maculata]